MKTFGALALLLATTSATMTNDDKLHFFEFDNAKMIWKNDWEFYRNTRDKNGEHDCKLAESDNFMGAQQCRF